MEEHIKKTNTQLLTPDGKDYFAIEKEANMQGNFYPQYLLTNDTFWEESYPLAMFEALEKEPIVLDKIIIDECQHLLLPWYMEVFNKMLKDGFANGKWYMFGDFTQQSTAHFFAEAELQHILNSYATNHYSTYNLTVNCRNSKNIADAILKLTGFGAVETPAKLTDCDVPNVEFHQFQNDEDQIRQLEKIINKLLSENNIKHNDITILGDLNKHKPEDFVFNGIRIISYSNKPSNNIRMSCITKFKGIESKVIILIDIDSYQNKRLIYQGMSRATTLLIILESEAAKTERSALC
jgi:hypothetical protein